MKSAPLLPVREAIRAVEEALPGPRPARVPLASAVGLVLAEEVRSDLDMPPFAKSMMDGFAVRAAETGAEPVELEVVGTIHAGEMPDLRVGPGQAAAIMTGAPLPDGADAVVMVERTERPSERRVRILDDAAPGQNVSPRGEDVREGDVVLEAGRVVRPGEVAVLASVGAVRVPVFARPRAAVFTTGDEVVPPAERPGPGHIRNSNSASLAARLVRDGAAADDRGIVPDDLDATREAVRGAMGSYDLVLLTGGVSMGEKDLVGRALLAEGFREGFHKIALKPGKPTLFGTVPGSLVFGLPGNPVSVSVTYELLVRPVVRRLLGHAEIHRTRTRARFHGPPVGAIPREQYVPAHLARGREGLTVRRLEWHGSADLFRFSRANSLLVVPAGGPAPEEGEEVEAVILDADTERLLAGDPDA